jgi:hypothetical protein
MNAFRALPLAQRQLLFVAAVVAVALLSMYVQLLHDSLARGAELREVQRVTGARKPANAPREQPATPLRVRQTSDTGNARAR